jgi:hypothetical protein
MCVTMHALRGLTAGVLRSDLSNLSGLPSGVYVGGAAGAPAAALEKLVSRCWPLNLIYDIGICIAQWEAASLVGTM